MAIKSKRNKNLEFPLLYISISPHLFFVIFENIFMVIGNVSFLEGKKDLLEEIELQIYQ